MIIGSLFWDDDVFLALERISRAIRHFNGIFTLMAPPRSPSLAPSRG